MIDSYKRRPAAMVTAMSQFELPIHIKNFCLLALLALAALPAAVQAQENLPSISIDTTRLKGASLNQFRAADRPVFNYPNQYLNDTLSLQYQNTLLEKMILRQGTIARTEKSFIDVGVPFKQPPPPRGICEQIPVNVPCYKAYPDLYPGAVPDVGSIEDGALPDDGSLPIPQEAVMDTKQPPAPAKPPEPDLKQYSWAEIMCAAGKCSAVLTNGSTRQTVHEGDTLDDGIKVTTISSTGVKVSKGGKTESLDSAMAPSRGGMASPKYASRDIGGRSMKLSGSPGNQAKQLESMFKPEPDAANAPAPAATGDQGIVTIPPDNATPTSSTVSAGTSADAGAVSDPGPPLGPTGLY